MKVIRVASIPISVVMYVYSAVMFWRVPISEQHVYGAFTKLLFGTSLSHISIKFHSLVKRVKRSGDIEKVVSLKLGKRFSAIRKISGIAAVVLLLLGLVEGKTPISLGEWHFGRPLLSIPFILFEVIKVAALHTFTAVNRPDELVLSSVRSGEGETIWAQLYRCLACRRRTVANTVAPIGSCKLVTERRRSLTHAMDATAVRRPDEVLTAAHRGTSLVEPGPVKETILLVHKHVAQRRRSSAFEAAAPGGAIAIGGARRRSSVAILIAEAATLRNVMNGVAQTQSVVKDDIASDTIISGNLGNTLLKITYLGMSGFVGGLGYAFLAPAVYYRPLVLAITAVICAWTNIKLIGASDSTRGEEFIACANLIGRKGNHILSWIPVALEFVALGMLSLNEGSLWWVPHLDVLPELAQGLSDVVFVDIKVVQDWLGIPVATLLLCSVMFIVAVVNALLVMAYFIRLPKPLIKLRNYGSFFLYEIFLMSVASLAFTSIFCLTDNSVDGGIAAKHTPASR